MELDERPTEQYSDIGGLDKQIEEVCYHFLTCFTHLSNTVSGGYCSTNDAQATFHRSWDSTSQRFTTVYIYLALAFLY